MLINLSELEQEREVKRAARNQDKVLRFINERTNKDLQAQIGALAMGEAVHFATGNVWSLHDLVVYCLGQTGPADLYLCTYAIKEYQARLFTNMKTEGAITSIHALLDYRAGTHDAAAVQLLAQGCERYATMRTHGKLTVLRNNVWGVAIVGSANMTKNTRGDVGVITCNTAIADEWINWITENMNDGIK